MGFWRSSGRRPHRHWRKSCRLGRSLRSTSPSSSASSGRRRQLPTAFWMPRFKSIGFMPAATDLAPSRTMAAAQHRGRGGAIHRRRHWSFAPPPRTICAPHVLELVGEFDFLGDRHAVLGSRRGAPEAFCRSRRCGPWGRGSLSPRQLRISTPRSSFFARASLPNFTSLAAMFFS